MNALGTALITGGGRGIGAAVAALAAARGYAVGVNYSTDEAGANAVVESILNAGGQAAVFRADVSREADVLELFTQVEADLGPITALVNNAGITGPLKRLADLEVADMTRVFEINVFGTMLCSREAVRRMSMARGGRGGAIVNISSRAAQIGGAGEWVHYAATKGAVDTFTLGLAREVASDGIRVNAVAPGLIDTGIHAAAGVPDRIARMAPSIPMGRAGSIEEVAHAVVWLLSGEASYITGAVLPIGGGR